MSEGPIETLCREFEGGRRRDWCRKLKDDFLSQLAVVGEGGDVNATDLRVVCESLLGRMTPQMRGKGLRFLRRVLEKGELSHLLDRMPRFLREVPDCLVRQRRLTIEDALPRSLRPPWLVGVFQDIVANEGTSSWKTSKTARQQLSMIYKFLRGTPLLSVATREEFETTMAGMQPDEAKGLCQAFLDGCTSASAARRYVTVLNLLFADLWPKLPERLRKQTLRRKRKFYTLRDLDQHVHSQSSAQSGDEHLRSRRDHFTPDEVRRLRDAAHQSPRDSLIVVMLLTTGLRRQALLNIRIVDVAEWSGSSWTARPSGITLTKGRKRHEFMLLGPARQAIERWLNSAEGVGGRPMTPSPYLFPSGTHDNGQLSDTALYKIFRAVCERAGFAGDDRCHPHALRHTYAHDLVDAQNPLSVVQASLGHSNIKNTQRYIQETTEDAMRKLVRPAHWMDAHSVPVTTELLNQSSAAPARGRASRQALRDMLAERAARQVSQVAGPPG